MGFSENLKMEMQKKGVTSYRVAKELGVHISTITNWLNGANPQLENLLKLSNFFNVPVEKLTKKETPSERAEQDYKDKG